MDGSNSNKRYLVQYVSNLSWHLLVSSYVRLAYAEMRFALEDEGTVHTRTGPQAAVFSCEPMTF